MRPSTNGLWFLVILITSAWFLLHPVRPFFCNTFRELHTFLPHRHPLYHPVSLCPCRTAAHTNSLPPTAPQIAALLPFATV